MPITNDVYSNYKSVDQENDHKVDYRTNGDSERSVLDTTAFITCTLYVSIPIKIAIKTLHILSY